MFMSSIEVIKDFVNDPAVINFKKNDQSRIIDACTIAENKGEIKGETKERTKMIQAFSKVLSYEKIKLYTYIIIGFISLSVVMLIIIIVLVCKKGKKKKRGKDKEKVVEEKINKEDKNEIIEI